MEISPKTGVAMNNLIVKDYTWNQRLEASESGVSYKSLNDYLRRIQRALVYSSN